MASSRISEVALKGGGGGGSNGSSVPMGSNISSVNSKSMSSTSSLPTGELSRGEGRSDDILFQQEIEKLCRKFAIEISRRASKQFQQQAPPIAPPVETTVKANNNELVAKLENEVRQLKLTIKKQESQLKQAQHQVEQHRVFNNMFIDETFKMIEDLERKVKN